MKRCLIACSALVALASPALASETATYTYDAQGRLKTVTSVQTGQTVTRTYAYDGANNRTSRVTTVAASAGGGAALAPSSEDAAQAAPESAPDTDVAPNGDR